MESILFIPFILCPVVPERIHCSSKE